MAECILFVEGAPSVENGNLRFGFQKLLQQADKLNRRMPEIEMSRDTAGAVRKFRLEMQNPASRFQRVLLLVDLDGADDTRGAWLAQYDLTKYHEQVFFMVQKMEAWFLAQPAVLHEFYAPKMPHALPKTAPPYVSHPDRELVRCTKDHPKKGTYHKTAHGARLLAKLRLTDLQASFPDVERLIAAL